jgi:hypothetical protein
MWPIGYCLALCVLRPAVKDTKQTGEAVARYHRVALLSVARTRALHWPPQIGCAFGSAEGAAPRDAVAIGFADPG